MLKQKISGMTFEKKVIPILGTGAKWASVTKSLSDGRGFVPSFTGLLNFFVQTVGILIDVHARKRVFKAGTLILTAV